jgi:hypothetical protein
MTEAFAGAALALFILAGIGAGIGLVVFIRAAFRVVDNKPPFGW